MESHHEKGNKNRCISLLGLRNRIPWIRGLKQQKFIFLQFWRLKSKIRVPARSGSGESSSWLAGGPLLTMSLCGLSSEYKERGREERGISLRSSVLSDWTPILMTSFNLNYFLKALSPDPSHWMSGLQHVNWWQAEEDTIESITTRIPNLDEDLQCARRLPHVLTQSSL